MSTILRVGGVHFKVDEFLARSQLEEDRVWHCGESGLGGRLHSDSGFTMVASEAEMSDLPQQILDSIAFLEANAEGLRELQKAPNVEYSCLDFGIKKRDVVVQTDSFSAELLRLAGNLNIGIDVTHYPILDED